MSLWWLCPDFVWENLITFWREKDNGPMISGFLFGLGWWLWIDTAANAEVSSVGHYIPGILATMAAILMNLFNGESISDYSLFDDVDTRRTRFWLLISYLASFGAFLGSIIILVSKYAVEEGASIWPGVVSLVLGSGLVFYLSKNVSSDSYLPVDSIRVNAQRTYCFWISFYIPQCRVKMSLTKMKGVLSRPKQVKSEKELAQEKAFIQKYGDLRPTGLNHEKHGRQYFDSADWSMYKDDEVRGTQLRQLPRVTPEKRLRGQLIRKSALCQNDSSRMMPSYTFTAPNAGADDSGIVQPFSTFHFTRHTSMTVYYAQALPAIYEQPDLHRKPSINLHYDSKLAGPSAAILPSLSL